MVLDDYGRQSDRADNGEVLIGRLPYKLRGGVRPQDLARWQGKILTGDPSADSDPLISADSKSSFTGGMGSFIVKEGVDDENYWTATMETRYPYMLTNLPKTWSYSIAPAASEARVLGDFPAAAPHFLAAFDSDIHRWDKINLEFDLVDTLPSPPSGKAVEFADKLFIPCANDGVVTLDQLDAVDAVTHAGIHAIALTIYDNKLVAITTEGDLRIMGVDETWEPQTDLLRLPSGYPPTGVLTFIDQQQNPVVHIITTKGVWSYDRQNTVLLKTHLQYPNHPQQGRASTVFRGDTMYVSVGIGIHSYSGNVITAMGPDGRFGLPASLRGYIVDLEQEYNGLLALVQGADSLSTDQQEFQQTPPTFQESGAVFPETNTESILLRWNQQGWHPVWRSKDASGTPTNIFVSEADGEYRLWWGYDGRMYTQLLPVTFFNPRVGMQIGESRFESYGELTTGWFDANMLAYYKLASHIELVIDDALENQTPLGDVTVRYQVDYDPTWHPLRTVSGVGRYVMPFGVIEREDGTDFSVGDVFRRIRFRIESNSKSETLTPLIQNVLFKYIKIPISQLSWTFDVDLTANEGYKGTSNEEALAYLESLKTSQEMTRFVHRNREFRVRIAQTSGQEQAGYDERGVTTVSVVEVGLPPDEASDSAGYITHTRIG